MNTFEYRIYYQWDGPSKADPFASEKSPDEVARALREFPGELSHRLQDLDAQVETTEVRAGVNEVRLRVFTTDSLEEVNRSLVKTLQEWRLYGEELHRAP